MISPPTLSLYVHFPWCVKKCPYCDFNSHSASSSLDQEGYIHALLDDLDLELSTYPCKRPLQSIFLGGGTPSLFTPASMGTLLNAIRRRFSLSGQCEITMEANPGTTEYHDFSLYLGTGINRLSLGVQSFDDLFLQALGRIHNAAHATEAFGKARDAGFSNINIDLMFGLPDQSCDQALSDLEQAISLDPEHISLYQLTLEPNTVFYRYPPRLPDDDTIIDMQTALQSRLDNAGYQQYEISAYSKPGQLSRHNLGYWEFGDYLGIGAGAHGKLSGYDSIIRRSRKKHPATFQQLAGTPSAVASSLSVAGRELVFEFLMNALRLRGGFSFELFQQRTGAQPDIMLELLDDSISKGLIVTADNRVRCSERGYLFLDAILTDIM